jgi:hypothetical protein
MPWAADETFLAFLDLDARPTRSASSRGLLSVGAEAIGRIYARREGATLSELLIELERSEWARSSWSSGCEERRRWPSVSTMDAGCSFCGTRPVVAWFEGPDFSSFAASAEAVSAFEVWLCCGSCLRAVQAGDRERIAQRGTLRVGGSAPDEALVVCARRASSVLGGARAIGGCLNGGRPCRTGKRVTIQSRISPFTALSSTRLKSTV